MGRVAWLHELRIHPPTRAAGRVRLVSVRSRLAAPGQGERSPRLAALDLPRARRSAAAEHDDRDLPVGLGLVVVVGGPHLGHKRPQALALGALGGVGAHGYDLAEHLDLGVGLGKQVLIPAGVFGRAASEATITQRSPSVRWISGVVRCWPELRPVVVSSRTVVPRNDSRAGRRCRDRRGRALRRRGRRLSRPSRASLTRGGRHWPAARHCGGGAIFPIIPGGRPALAVIPA